MNEQIVRNLPKKDHQEGQLLEGHLDGGYRVKDYNGKQYIVPEFLAPSTEQALRLIEMREQAEKNAGNPRIVVCAVFYSSYFDVYQLFYFALILNCPL